jgi:hypothetical protein
MIRLRYARTSLCSCGHPMLKESVPLGTIYLGDESDTQYETIRCGGCRKRLRLKTIYVVRVGRDGRYGDTPGFLPMELFDRALDPRPKECIEKPPGSSAPGDYVTFAQTTGNEAVVRRHTPVNSLNPKTQHYG